MIKYAGVNTLLPTPEVEEFISRLLNESDMRFWYDPGNGPDVGASAPVVPRLNWQRTFQPRLNTLIWPTGASRWASMLLLVTSEQLAAIKLLTDPSASSVYGSAGKQLVIADAAFQGDVESDAFTREVTIPAEGDTPATYGHQVALSVEMHALEARPVSLPYEYKFNEETEEWGWQETTEKTLWLLPIVDRRWFCQWFTIQDHPWETWKEAIESCLDRVGPRDETTPHTDYGTPPADLYERVKYANAAELADTFAHSVGQRITRRVDGLFRSTTPADAATTWDNNFDGDDHDPFEVWVRIAGGDYTDKHKAAATIPENVRVVFLDGTSSITTTEDAGAIQWSVAGTVANLFPASDGTSDKDAFSLQATKDYLAWLAKKADIVFSGVKAWRMTGFEDFVLWSVSPSTGITTRVVTHPETLGMLPIGGTDTACIRSYDLRLLWNPSAGTMSIDVKFHDVTQTISIGITDDETDVKAAVDAHTEFVAAEVECTAESAGGFPSSNILLTLPSGATIVAHDSTLTPRSGSPDPEFRVDICGCAST